MTKILNALVFICYFAQPLMAAGDDNIFVVPVEKNEIKVMSYNVENLFDAVHDEGKNDYEFLPAKSPEKKKCGENKQYEKSCRKLDWTAP